MGPSLAAVSWRAFPELRLGNRSGLEALPRETYLGPSASSGGRETGVVRSWTSRRPFPS